MKRSVIIKEALLVLTTIIWGLGFIAQSIGGEYLDAFSFNLLRNVVAFIVLLLICLIKRGIDRKKNTVVANNKKNMWIGGSLIGLALAVAMTLQQIGINLEGAGKSGFITALYIVFVPMLGLLFGRKINKLVLIAIVFSLTGLYLINTNSEGFSFGLGSVYLLGCALAYSVQIMLVDKFSKDIDVFTLSCLEFFFASIFLIPFALIFGSFNIDLIIKALPAILFLGICSSGIAYTLQVYAQTEVNVNVACIIMALESVFSLIFGMIILSEKHGTIELLGCVCIFASVILSQIEPNKREKKNETSKD